jgi:hypothetical protein
MPKVRLSSWNGGTAPVAVVNKASVAHSRMAMKPISVARNRSGWCSGRVAGMGGVGRTPPPGCQANRITC